MPAAVTTLPATTGTCGSSERTAPSGVEHLALVAVRGVDDEHVDAGLEQLGRLRLDVAVDADGGGDAQPALRRRAPGW